MHMHVPQARNEELAGTIDNADTFECAGAARCDGANSVTRDKHIDAGPEGSAGAVDNVYIFDKDTVGVNDRRQGEEQQNADQGLG